MLRLSPVVTLWLLVSSLCLGQAVEIVKHKGITGLQDPVVVGDFILVNDAANLKVQEVAIISVNSEASNISVEASDITRSELPVSSIDKNTYVVQGSGKIWIEVFCVDFAKNIFLKEKKTIELNNGPTPPGPTPPGPTPPNPTPDTVPDDLFDNIGKRVNEWSTGLTANVEMSNAYLKAYKFLKENPGATVNDGANLLNSELLKIAAYSTYSSVMSKVNQDLSDRWSKSPLSKGVLADYWKAVAVGFNPKGVK